MFTFLFCPKFFVLWLLVGVIGTLKALSLGSSKATVFSSAEKELRRLTSGTLRSRLECYLGIKILSFLSFVSALLSSFAPAISPFLSTQSHTFLLGGTMKSSLVRQHNPRETITQACLIEHAYPYTYPYCPSSPPKIQYRCCTRPRTYSSNTHIECSRIR